MAKTISKSRFNPKSLELFRTVEQTGEVLIITDHGRPVLKIVPYSEDPEQWLKGLRNTVIRYEKPFEPVGEND